MPKQTRAEYLRQWRKDNPEKAYAHNHTPNAKEARRVCARNYYNANPEKCSLKNKEWRENNKEHRAQYMSDYGKTHRPEINERKKVTNKLRYDSDPAYKIMCLLRTRLTKSIRNAMAQKASNTLDLLGCSIGRFGDYISAHFKPGMSWAKVLTGEIHIDHIKPIASFDLTDPEQQKACFHFLNLQPLWSIENLTKGSTYPINPKQKLSLVA